MEQSEESYKFLSLTHRNRESLSQYYNTKGTESADEGDLKEALNLYTKAIELNPQFTIALFNRGTIKADLGDYKGANEDFCLARNIERKKRKINPQGISQFVVISNREQ